MSFPLYLVGFLVFTIGVALGAYYLNVPPRWIVVIVVVLVGLGIISGVTNTRRRDPPA
jgi:uncharacterized membrane protein YiaA